MQYGSAIFIGIQYRPSKNFSISTEPGFYWLKINAEDPTNFDPDQRKTSWTELNLDNIGQLLISVHF